MTLIINILILYATCVKLCSSSESDVVVIDSGSGYLKAGLADGNDPEIVIPDVMAIAVRNFSGHIITQTFVGESAQDKRWVIPLYYPVNYGYLTDAEAMEVVWRHVFKHELKIDPSSAQVVITQSPLTTTDTTRVLWETMKSLGSEVVGVEDTALMTLKFAGRSTGLVIESGHEATFVVPVVEGVPIESAIQYLKLGGQDVTLYVANLFGHSHTDGIRSNSMTYLSTLFKETKCYVAENYDTEPPTEEVFEWAWGEEFVLGTIPFQGPEVLFKPYLNGISGHGISEAVFAAVQACDVDIHEELLQSIVLGGGNTMFPGFAERIEADLSAWTGIETEVIALDNREYSAWIGASKSV